MNVKKFTVIGLLSVVVIFFFLGMNSYQSRVKKTQDDALSSSQSRLIRMNSPTFGPENAPVTIVEFFDPACETCRAFYPIVKNLLAKYPEDLRLVIRYAPFHTGSDEVVKLLEAARIQGKYESVLEAVLDTQPLWADHGRPDVSIAFKVAEQVGLDLEKAIKDIELPRVQSILKQDIEDLTALQVTKTPTFFVNGKSLPSFGEQQLLTLISEELSKVK